MTILKFPQKQQDALFFEDIINDAYHVFSLKNVKIPNYYPNEFPDDGDAGVSIKDLKVGDTITIRVFFRIDDIGEEVQAEGGYLDLLVEHIEDKAVIAVIFTELPEEFALATNDSIEVFEEEILYKIDEQEH